jgi:TolB-like protein/class 3 adenylate cyclase/tetratricopeptide (TPR) repeat protein
VSETGVGPDVAGKAAGGRRLIAIVYADMVGFSRLVGLDDAGTLRRLRTLRKALIDPAIREHSGRLAKTGGDSLLVVFDSIDEAVRCAVKVQQQVPVYDGDQPPDRRIRFRVGINTGDVIPDGTDLYGDSVNVAARLEAECPVGGICISRAVRDQVHGRLDLPFEAVGELTLKNIARPVEAFVLRLDPTAEERSTHAPADAGETSQPIIRFRIAVAAAVAVVIVFGAATGWWFTRTSTVVPKAPEATPAATASQAPASVAAKAAAPPDVGLSNAPKFSIVALPFNNLGGEGVEEDVVDGITEDLTTDLSRVPDFLVIARNSAFTYKGKPIDVKRVGEELGVRYAVEGSVRKIDGALRVNVQLVSTESGTHLWAERFDVRRDGVGYGVDDIVRQIAFTLSGRIVDTEAARNLRERPSNPEVADILLRARSIYNRPPTPQQQAELVPLYERALELDPKSATAMVGLAETLLNTIGSPDDPSIPEKLRRADELVNRAVLLRPDDMAVMWVRVFLLGEQRRCSEMLPAAQRALDVYPNLTGPRQWQGICLTWMGRYAEAIAPIEDAIRINPRNPNIGTRDRWMGYPLLFLGRYDEAVVWFERSLAANPGDHRRSEVYVAIAAAQALAGHTEQARLNASEATRLDPTITARSYNPINFDANPERVAEVSHVRDGMRLAGIRDHANEDADFGLPADDVLHTNYQAPTPTTLPGAQIIRTPDLVRLPEQRKPLVIDTVNWGLSISGAVGLWGAGIGGSTTDQFQDRLARKMQQLTAGNKAVPIVAVGFNSERYQGRNLALRLVALGYTNVYWYRGGREAWEVAGLPETEVDVLEW